MNVDPDRFDTSLGREIAQRRTEARLTRSDLAKALGVTYQQIQKYEAGKSSLNFARLMQIAAFLEVPLVTLLPEKDRAAVVAEPNRESTAQSSIGKADPKDLALAQAISQIDDAVAKEALIALVRRMSQSKMADR